MSTALQIRRGTTLENSTFTGLAGELTVDTDLNELIVHDGTTQGGNPVIPVAGEISGFLSVPTKYYRIKHTVLTSHRRFVYDFLGIFAASGAINYTPTTDANYTYKPLTNLFVADGTSADVLSDTGFYSVYLTLDTPEIIERYELLTAGMGKFILCNDCLGIRGIL